MNQSFQKILCLFVTVLVSVTGWCQSLNYTHYDTKDGLAGTTVYEMCQDKKGYLWFATDNGLSRYDGTNFKTYTVAEGLPDNEVLKVFADVKGRVWIGTFSNELAYYEDGKIYNKTNDKTLGNPILKIQALYFFEDSGKNILITDNRKAVLIEANNHVVDFTAMPEISSHTFERFTAGEYFNGKGFTIRLNDTNYRYENGKLEFYNLDNERTGADKYFPQYFKSGRETTEKRIEIYVPASIITSTTNKGIVIFQSTLDGSWSVDTINNKLGQQFLPGKKITRTLIDNEQNTWFSTLGEGVYKLASTGMQTIEFSDLHNRASNEVYTISPFNDQLLIGLGSSKMAFIKNNALKNITDISAETKKSANPNISNRLYCSYTDHSGRAFLGFDAFLAKKENASLLFSRDLLAVKSIDEVDSDHIIVSTFAFAVKVRKSDLKVVDTIWIGRCTEAYYTNGYYLVGTMKGLYKIDSNKQVTYLGDMHPALKRKISDIKTDQLGNIFIATIDMGVIVLNNEKVKYWLNDENGLSGNSCKCLYVGKNNLWVGTSNGISKIDLHNYNTILRYGISDGLPSNNINCIYKKDSMVWVGSPAGLTFFKEATVASSSHCLLDLTTFTEGKLNSSGVYELSYKSPQINFEFVGITYRSGGNVSYYYRIIGLDERWTKTTLNNLNFSALPSGDYTFELYAVNKFNVKSETKHVSFTISKPLWKSWLFYLSIIVITILLTAYFINKRNEGLKQKLIEEQQFHKRFVELEQQALQAQMNPQFIFTSLQSIQNYIKHNEKRKANEFLTGFAYLIRQTLDISGKNRITIAEEIQFLQSYLNMEKLKGELGIKYSVKVDHEMQSDIFEIPPLMLQPFVENTIKRAKACNASAGLNLQMEFSLENEMIGFKIVDDILCDDTSGNFENMIEDSQLKGIILAKKRIDLMNELSQAKIQVSAQQLHDKTGNTGSELTIKIPIILYAQPD